MVNFEIYKNFIIVAENKSITKASKILFISQPAITKQMKNLENTLNTILFIRTSHGILLTEDGKKLYNEIKDSVYKILNVEKLFQNSNEIFLGIHASISRIFTNCINKFYISHKNSHIVTCNYENEDMLEKLLKNEINIIFSKKIVTSKIYKNIKYINLGILTDVLVTHKNSKWAKKNMKLQDLKQNMFYMPRKYSETPKNFFISTNTGIKDYKYLKNISYLTMMKILKNTDAVGLVTKEFFLKEIQENDLVEVKVDFNINKINFGIYINDFSTKDIKDLKEIILEEFKCQK